MTNTTLCEAKSATVPRSVKSPLQMLSETLAVACEASGQIEEEPMRSSGFLVLCFQTLSFLYLVQQNLSGEL